MFGVGDVGATAASGRRAASGLTRGLSAPLRRDRPSPGEGGQTNNRGHAREPSKGSPGVERLLTATRQGFFVFLPGFVGVGRRDRCCRGVRLFGAYHADGTCRVPIKARSVVLFASVSTINRQDRDVRQHQLL